MTAWTPLDGGSGRVLAASSGTVAAALPGRITVWTNGDGDVVAVDADRPNPARPRIVGHEVCWGQVVVDLQAGTHRVVALEGMSVGGYEQSAHAWGPDGSAAVAAAAWTGPSGSPPAMAALFDADGTRRAVLWEASDLAPVAVWCGADRVVVGCRSPQVFDRAGQPSRALASDTPPFRIEADDAEEVALVAEYARLAAWRLDSGVLMGECAGTWVDAALTPDGTRVVAATFDGTIEVRRVGAGLDVIGVVEADDRATALAVTDRQIVAAFARPPEIRTAAFV